MNPSSVDRLSDEDVRELVAWRKLPSLIRREVDPMTPSDFANVPPYSRTEPGISRDTVNGARVDRRALRTAGGKTTSTTCRETDAASGGRTSGSEQERKALERDTIAEIRTLVRKSTRARDSETWFWRINPLTDRKEVKWSVVLPAAMGLFIAFYGGLRLYAAPGQSSVQKTTLKNMESSERATRVDADSRSEESLFTPRSQYSIPGAESEPSAPEVEPSDAPPAPTRQLPPPPTRPVAPESWQAGLTMAIPAESEIVDDLVYEDAEPHSVLFEGTRIPAVLIGTLASSFESPVQAQLDVDFVEDDRVLLPKGTVLLGASQANATQRRIYVRFHRAILPSGDSLDIRGTAQNADLSTGLTADRVEKHRTRNVLAGALGGLASRVAGLGGTRLPGAAEGARAANAEAINEVRGSGGNLTLYVTAGRRVFVYLEADTTVGDPRVQ
jgi:hypothetical protein